MISDPQDVTSLKGREGAERVATYEEAKASCAKAEHVHKSYFGKDKDKQLHQIMDDPLKKAEQVPIDLSKHLH
jgi:hypothetical protein